MRWSWVLWTAVGCAAEGKGTAPTDGATTHTGAPTTTTTDTGCDTPTTWYEDGDGDGVGSRPVEACVRPAGTSEVAGDCDDADSAVHPEAAEVCNGVDDNCSGDESDAIDPATWSADLDGDGFGDPGAQTLACTAPVGSVADASDCDDASPAIHPAATDACNGVDDDCSGDETNAVDTLPWHPDEDGDGYGDGTTTVFRCTAPVGSVADASDCDDDTDAVHPTATDHCNGVDDNCSGDESDAIDPATWSADLDGDGFGDPGAQTLACTAPVGSVADASDCDDASPAIHPAATDTCNGVDDNCSGDESDAIDPATWSADLDDDGFGDPGAQTLACTAPVGSVADASDCDDASPAIHPAATDACNGVDDDCSGDETNAVDTLPWHPDDDGDGYGDGTTTVFRCTAPVGSVADASDCDDDDDAVHPTATDHCNGVDDNCSGDESDAIDPATWSADLDGDGFGDPGAQTLACTAPVGSVADASDCDDVDPDVFPGAPELCDGHLNGCDPSASELGTVTWFPDATGRGVSQDAVFAAGADFAPIDYDIVEDGTLRLCGGTFHASILDLAPTSLRIEGFGSTPSTLSGGHVARIIQIAGATSLTLSDLSLTDGHGCFGVAVSDMAQSECTPTSGSFGFDGPSEVWFDRVHVSGSSGELGFSTLAASPGSHWTLTDTVVTGPEPRDGTGIEAWGADIDLIDSQIVRFYHGINGFGGAITCTGSPSNDAGLWNHEVAIQLNEYLPGSTGTLVSTSCDFDGPTDNSNDLLVSVSGPQAFFSKGDDETFVCDTITGCP